MLNDGVCTYVAMYVGRYVSYENYFVHIRICTLSISFLNIHIINSSLTLCYIANT